MKMRVFLRKMRVIFKKALSRPKCECFLGRRCREENASLSRKNASLFRGKALSRSKMRVFFRQTNASLL